MSNLKFFHFGVQCPHNSHLISLIQRVSKSTGASALIYDISNREDICLQYNIYSPTLLLVNDTIRWNGPFSEKDLLKLLQDVNVKRQPYIVNQSTNRVKGKLVPITAESVEESCVPCFGTDQKHLCNEKRDWVMMMLARAKTEQLGFLHFYRGKCVGGAEFLPSDLIPYPIPGKAERVAFLTCVFLSDENKDYKSYPLQALTEHLRGRGFKSLLAIASEDVVFPNGPLWWFLAEGFVDRGEVFYESQDQARMHLVEMPL
ncbi:MAG: hypothetical protein DDT25_00673 [Chloroflexi bacterium]|nr:hypothetical protein [Chloroflexota bacterium]